MAFVNSQPRQRPFRRLLQIVRGVNEWVMQVLRFSEAFIQKWLLNSNSRRSTAMPNQTRPRIANGAAGVVALSYTAVLMSVLMSAPVSAATLASWHGPGDRACHGRCDVEWAMSLLPEERRKQVAAAMKSDPDGQSLPVENGDFIPLMSYFYQDAARMDRRGTVAVLDAPEPAFGWQFDGWSFVKIVGCQNWAVVNEENLPLGGSGTDVIPSPQIRVGDVGSSSLFPYTPTTTGTTWPDLTGIHGFVTGGSATGLPPAAPPTLVSLPRTAAFLLLGLALLVVARLRVLALRRGPIA